MIFQCLDCTYKGTQFIAGACPGCGSMNIKRIAKKGEDTPPKARRSYRMTMAWALWIYLFYKGLDIAGFL